MITTRNNFNGAAFDYASEACTACGEFRYLNNNLQSVNINGEYRQEEVSYTFFANLDENGNVNISGVPFIVIGEVAAEVATIIAEIRELNPVEDTESEE